MGTYGGSLLCLLVWLTAAQIRLSYHAGAFASVYQHFLDATAAALLNHQRPLLVLVKSQIFHFEHQLLFGIDLSILANA